MPNKKYARIKWIADYMETKGLPTTQALIISKMTKALERPWLLSKG